MHVKVFRVKEPKKRSKSNSCGEVRKQVIIASVRQCAAAHESQKHNY